MDRLELTALRARREYTQADVANVLGVTQGFVSQLERGERSVPDAIAERLERLLAVGSPQRSDEPLSYLVCQPRASGFLYAPSRSGTTQVFRERPVAEAARDCVRAAGFTTAIVVPAWHNGLAALLIPPDTGEEPSVEEVAVVSELILSFRLDRRGLIGTTD